MMQRLRHGRGRVVVILQIALQVAVVGRHVEVTVAAQVEGDDLLLAALLASQRLFDGHGDGVGGLRRGDDALGAQEGQPGSPALTTGTACLGASGGRGGTGGLGGGGAGGASVGVAWTGTEPRFVGTTTVVRAPSNAPALGGAGVTGVGVAGVNVDVLKAP